MPNGGPFHNQPAYQGSVVPAKRPHDGMSGSPPPPSVSRSQTPGYPNYSTPQPGQQFSAPPNPFAHLQQPGSNQATPSPTMQNQQFRPPPAQQQQQRMSNASPSPFPNQQQQNQQNQFGGQMPHQGQSPAPNMPHQGVGMGGGPAAGAGGFGQPYGMPPMSMPGMPSAMSAQASAMAGMSNDAQQYRLKLMQQQRQMQQAQSNGMVGPRPVGGQQNPMFNQAARQQMGAQLPGGMPPGQSQNQNQNQSQNPNQSQNQNQNQKRMAFMQTLRNVAQQSGQPFNMQPTIGGRPVDLFALWSITTQLGGMQKVDTMNQWPMVAAKLGFPQQQIPSAPEEMKRIHATSGVAAYEKMWFARQMHAKQEQARMHAQQMAGLGAQPAGSPTKMMQTPTQPPTQMPQFNQNQQAQTPQNPQATPVQANIPLPPNGMSTPTQMMGTPLQQHRRNSSLRKPDMTPQAVNQSLTAPSPKSVQKTHRSPSIKQEAPGMLMKLEESHSTVWEPQMRYITSDGGYETEVCVELGGRVARVMPAMPTVDEMGVIDTRAITLSLASGIHSEVRYALDALAIISMDSRISFDLEKCEDLIDVLVDCAEEQTELLSDDAAEVSDALDLPSYEDIMRSSRLEAETLQDVPGFGTHQSDLDLAADRLIAITTVLRNFSFFEHNHRLLTTASLIKWLSSMIRLLGTRNMLLRTWFNTQDFYKDTITFLSNVTQSLELPTKDDALHILHFLLAFGPQPAPSYDSTDGDKIRFTNFNPAIHRYLPPAIDCLAKLLARTEPNRGYYRSIFAAAFSPAPVSTTGTNHESPLDLLTKAFALSVSVLPDRTKGNLVNQVQYRIVEARKAYLTQGMLAADILTSLLPSDSSDSAEVARSWLQSEDGWALGLLNMAALLSVDKAPGPQAPNGMPGGRGNIGGPGARGELGYDYESFRLITYRALMMLKRLINGATAEDAEHKDVTSANHGTTVNGDTDKVQEVDQAAKRRKKSQQSRPFTLSVSLSKHDGIPQRHTIQGALLLERVDKTALGLLSELYDCGVRAGYSDDENTDLGFPPWWDDDENGDEDAEDLDVLGAGHGVTV
ncbi:hypothetical protein K431DRAFT_233216 [Polychaeton citri CBS 116435]|uniref:ARID domain-containing protein n=1 Tax=Polychaeton citri CBS 116435 TaxID=1314669 RepID=A0A9P4ULJ2_9PEZI|nr:hypothetical protein K431DRAFT_233216 [Polychaeton citri CBS 116435]